MFPIDKKNTGNAVGMDCNLSRENKTNPKSTWVTLPRYGGNEIIWAYGEIGRRVGFRFRYFRVLGFDSLYAHQ